jgi:hypothetical protein
MHGPKCKILSIEFCYSARCTFFIPSEAFAASSLTQECVGHGDSCINERSVFQPTDCSCFPRKSLQTQFVCIPDKRKETGIHLIIKAVNGNRFIRQGNDLVPVQFFILFSYPFLKLPHQFLLYSRHNFLSCLFVSCLFKSAFFSLLPILFSRESGEIFFVHIFP